MRWICVLAVVVGVVGCGGGDSHSTAVAPARAITCPNGSPSGLDARRLVGLSEAGARELASRSSCSVRVVERDGRHSIITTEYSLHRINLALRRGKVTGVPFVG